MRKFIAVLFLLSFFNSWAYTPYHWNCGTFTVDATDTLISCPPISTNYIYFTITNTGTVDIYVRQIINSSNLPAGWSVNMCNPNGCWGSNVLVDTFLVPASSFVTARFDFHANTNTGTGITNVRFDDSATPVANGATFDLYAVSQGTGMDEEAQDSDNSIFVYPNPAMNELRIQNLPANRNGLANWQAGAELRIESIEIHNLSGQKVFSSPLSSPLLQERGTRGEVINISSLPSGIYFVRVRGESKERIGKFVKE